VGPETQLRMNYFRGKKNIAKKKKKKNKSKQANLPPPFFHFFSVTNCFPNISILVIRVRGEKKIN